MTQTRSRIIDVGTEGIPRDHGRFNVNGPAALAAPEWMPERPGRYLMYFAHHVGQSIRLAAADEPAGPWRMVESDAWYGVAMPSQVVRSVDGLRGFEYGPMLFDDDEIRHSCVSFRPDRRELEMLFTRCFEAPERIYRTVIDASGDWRQWSPGPVSEVMRPAEPWEGAGEPLKPVARGLAASPQNGLRDPYVLEDGGRRWRYYAASGEHAIGVTEF